VQNDGALLLWQSAFMTDLIYIVVLVAFFVVGGLYVRFCEKL